MRGAHFTILLREPSPHKTPARAGEEGEGLRQSRGRPAPYRGKPAGGHALRDRDLARRLSKRKRGFRRAVPRIVVAAAIVAVLAVLAVNAGTPRPAAPPPPAKPALHISFHIAIFNGTESIEVPAGLGVDPALHLDHSLDGFSTTPGTAVLHTNDTSGTVYIDSKVVQPYYLGDFWHIWNQPYGPNRTMDMHADANHTLTMTVDGQPYAGVSWGQLVLTNGMQIEVRRNAV